MSGNNRRREQRVKRRPGKSGKGRRIFLAAAAAVMLAGSVSGCSGKISSLVSEGMGTEGFSDAQMMLVVASERNRCQKIYTDQIWDIAVDDAGTTFQTYLLAEIQKFLKELRVMNLLADERQISLSAREKEQLNALADSYYESMSEADRAYTGASRDDVYTMYEAYHRANRLVDALTQNVNLEVSDSEARVITVQEASFAQESEAQAFWRRVTEDGIDFQAAVKESSLDGTAEKSVGRGERQKAYEDAVFALESGQISPVFQDGERWYVVKCVNDYDENATLERKQKMALERKNQAFRQIYDSFAENHQVESNGGFWERLSLKDGAESETDDFFEQYRQVMDGEN